MANNNVWQWLATHDTPNNDIRGALAAQGFDNRTTFAQIRTVKLTLEPILVGTNHVTVAMVAAFFEKAERNVVDAQIQAAAHAAVVAAQNEVRIGFNGPMPTSTRTAFDQLVIRKGKAKTDLIAMLLFCGIGTTVATVVKAAKEYHVSVVFALLTTLVALWDLWTNILIFIVIYGIVRPRDTLKKVVYVCCAVIVFILIVIVIALAVIREFGL